MAVDLTTKSLLDYLKSIDGFYDTCTTATCFEKRKELYEQHCEELGYTSCADPTVDHYYKGLGWQNTKLLDFLKSQTPAFHTTFQNSQSSSNTQPTTTNTPAPAFSKTELFPALRTYIANSEGGPGSNHGVEATYNDGNIVDDYHIGYFQIAGKQINTYLRYLQKYLIQPGATPTPQEIKYQEEIDNWHSAIFEAAYEELKFAMSGKLDCTLFPQVFSIPEQEFLHCLHMADAVHGKPSHTFEKLILQNITGKHGYLNRSSGSVDAWSLDNIHTNIYEGNPNLRATTAFEYLLWSGIPSVPKKATTQEEFDKIFVTNVSRQAVYDSVIYYAKEAYNHPDSRLKNYFPFEAIDRYFAQRTLNDLYTCSEKYQIFGIDTAYSNINQDASIAVSTVLSSSTSKYSTPPKNKVTAAVIDNTINTDVQKIYDTISVNPLLYKFGLSAEETGLTYIGDILIAVPPVSIRYSEHNQSTSVETMRTSGDPLFTYNNTIPRIDMTLMFNGSKAINEQLRPLVAMFHRMPFSTVQNFNIWDMWIGRREAFNVDLQTTPGGTLLNRYAPIPIYLESINVSTIPGFPDSVQAHISLVRMNRSPFGVSARMWKGWEDAVAASRVKTVRTARDSTIWSTDRDERNAVDKVYILDGAHKNHIFELGDDAAGGNKMMDETLSTKYPQESVPYKYQYRNLLWDDGFPDPTAIGLPKSVRGKNIYGKPKDPLLHWPAYRSEDNRELFLTYKSARKFSDKLSLFKVRLTELATNYQRIQTLSRQISTMSAPELLKLYKPITEMTLKNTAELLVDSLSAVKVGKDFAKNLTNSFNQIVLEILNDSQGNQLPFYANITEYCTVYLDSNGNAIKDLTTCEANGGTWETTGTPGFRSPFPPYDLIPVPLVSADDDDFIYVDANGEITNSFEVFLTWLNDVNRATGTCVEDETYVTEKACKSAKYSWKKLTNDDDQKNALWEKNNAIYKAFYNELIANPIDALGLNGVGSKWNYDTAGVQLSWITEGDDLLAYDTDIKSLVESDEHTPTENSRASFPFFYHFQSVVQSVNYSFSNQVVPLFMASSNLPSYQHMGIPNPTVSIVLRTRDERIHKVLTDMKETVQEVGSQTLSGNMKLIGLGTIDVSGNILSHSSDRKDKRNNPLNLPGNTGSLSGNLLNSLGFCQSSVQNITSRTLEGFPGWWEISLDLIADSQNIRIIEHLEAASVEEIPEGVNSLMDDLFPAYKANWDILTMYKQAADKNEFLRDKTARLEEIRAERAAVEAELASIPDELWYQYFNLGTCADVGQAGAWPYMSSMVRSEYTGGRRVQRVISELEYSECRDNGKLCDGINLGKECTHDGTFGSECYQHIYSKLNVPGLTLGEGAEVFTGASFNDTPADIAGNPGSCGVDETINDWYECQLAGIIEQPDAFGDSEACHALASVYEATDPSTDAVYNKDTFISMHLGAQGVCTWEEGQPGNDYYWWGPPEYDPKFAAGHCFGAKVNGWYGDPPARCESTSGGVYWVGNSNLVWVDTTESWVTGGHGFECPGGDRCTSFFGETEGFEEEWAEQYPEHGHFPIITSKAICDDPWGDNTERNKGLWIEHGNGFCSESHYTSTQVDPPEEDDFWGTGNRRAHYHDYSNLVPLAGISDEATCCTAGNATNTFAPGGKCTAKFDTWDPGDPASSAGNMPYSQTQITEDMLVSARKACLEWIGWGVDAKVGTGPKPNRKLINNKWTQVWYEWSPQNKGLAGWTNPLVVSHDRRDLTKVNELEQTILNYDEEETTLYGDIQNLQKDVGSIVEYLQIVGGEALNIYVNPELTNIEIQIAGSKVTAGQLYGIADSKQGLFQELFRPTIAEMVMWLQRIKKWEQDKMKSHANWTDDYPIEFQLTKTLASYYADFLKNCIYTISGIAGTEYGVELLSTPLKAVSLFPGYSRTASEAQKLTMVDQPDIIMQSLILSSQLKVIFYNILRRSDFRMFLDEQIVPRNKAIKALRDAMKKELKAISVGTGHVNYNINENTIELAKQRMEEAIRLIENSDEFLDTSSVPGTSEYSAFIKNLNSSIKINHPDLGLPREHLEGTGHNAVSPGYPFVDDDMDLELIEMSKMADQIKMQTFSQLAAITSGKFSDYYTQLMDELGHFEGDCYLDTISEDKCKAMISGDHDDVKPNGKHEFYGAGNYDSNKGWCMMTSFNDGDPLTAFSCESAGWLFNYKRFVPKGDGKTEGLSTLLKNSFTGVDNLDFTLPASISNTDQNALDIPKMLMSFKELAAREKEIQDGMAKGANGLAGSTSAAPSKKAIMDLMATTSMLDYLLMLMYGAAYMSEIQTGKFKGTGCYNASGKRIYTHVVASSNNSGGTRTIRLEKQATCEAHGYVWKELDLIETEMSALATQVLEDMKEINMDTSKYSSLLASTLALPYADELEVSAKGHDIAIAISQQILEKRKAAADIATISATGNYQAFLNYFGIGSIDSVQRSFELKNKFNNYMQNKDRASMDRAFPAYKLFFIEQDQFSWQAFDDFYTYDAVNEITVVESKHAASKTAVIKLSNVTNKLTNDIGIGILNEGASVTPGALLRLKVGTPVMLMLGYGADYRQLRMVFRGAVTEMQTGPILELTCQSWGAGLLNSVGAGDGVSYTTMSGATSLGSAVIDILAQTPGLSGLGRWEMRDGSLNNANNVAETTFKNAWWARALNSFSGTMGDYINVDSNISDMIGTFTGSGLPTTAADLQEGIRTNNVIYKAIGNSLYDNIVINDKNPSGYGFFNFVSRAKSFLYESYYKKPFKWHVVRQTCWDALHEVALYLGDYIITTRPFNEGNDILNQAPRDTLYFGPREGRYRAKTYVPKVNEEYEMEKLAELVKSSAMPTKNINLKLPGSGPGIFTTVIDTDKLKWMSSDEKDKMYEDDWDLDNKMLDFGKTALSRILDFHISSGDLPGGGEAVGKNNTYYTKNQAYMGTNCDDDPNNYSAVSFGSVASDKNIMNNFTHSLVLNGFIHTASKYMGSQFPPSAEDVKDSEWEGQSISFQESEFRVKNPYSYAHVNSTSRNHIDIDYRCYSKQWKCPYIEVLNHSTSYDGAPPGVVKQILLNDWAGTYNRPGHQYPTFDYSKKEWDEIIDPISRGKSFWPQDYVYEDKDGYIYQGIYSYGVDPTNTLFGWLDDRPELKGKFEGKPLGTDGSPEMEERHWNNWDGDQKTAAKYSAFPWMFAGYSLYSSGVIDTKAGAKIGAGRDADEAAWYDFLGGNDETESAVRDNSFWYRMWHGLFHDDTMRQERAGIDRAIINDVRSLVLNYYEIIKNQQKSYDQWSGGSLRYGIDELKGNPWAMDLQEALATSGGYESAFAYKPVVDCHAVNSYEDIIDNSIVATTDQMYNHVEVLYGDNADPTNSVTNAKYKTQAMISYDQDPDYIRTYQSYQKNINPNNWYDMSEADSHVIRLKDGGSPDGQRVTRAMGLQQTRVAQAILMNQMRPMYQGTLTLVGNPHIKAWDIVHMHDDSIGMFGPVEVEQVVHHLSPTEGYTTTIIPNLLVYYRSATASVDSIIMNIHSSIVTLNYFFIVAKHGAMQLGVAAMTQPLRSSGAFGTAAFRAMPFIGTGLNRLNKKFMKWDNAIDLFKDASLDDVLADKDVARKYLKKGEFIELEDLVAKRKSQQTQLNLVRNRCHARIQYANVTRSVGAVADDMLELERLITQKNAGNRGPTHARKIKNLEKRIAKKLGKGDLTAGRKLLTAMTSGKMDAAMGSIDDVIEVYSKIDPDHADLKDLKALQERIRTQKDELAELVAKRKNTKVKTGSRSRFKSLGNTIANKKQALTKNLNKFNKSSELIRKSMQKKIQKEIKGSGDEILKRSVKSLSKRKAAAALGGKLIPIVGWIWSAYDFIKMGSEMFNAYSQAKIFMCGMLSGENQLMWLPLEYQGKDYVAGLEGIIGTPRAVETILYGELTGDLSNNNRGMLVMNMLAKFKQSEEM